MLFGQDREQIRRFYCDVWRKHCAQQALEPLEKQIADIISQHPEYHALLENPDQASQQAFTPENGQSNPFLHMGLHMAILEQVSANQPDGIRNLYQQLLSQTGDAHQLEHQMMECLVDMIWRSQRDGTTPDQQTYLQCVRKLLKIRR